MATAPRSWACLAVSRRRQEGPADAVQPGAGSAPPKRTSAGAASAEGEANAAADGGGEAGGWGRDPTGEDAAGDGGEDSEGDEGKAGEGGGGEAVEEGKYCVAVADSDMLTDLDKQWQNVHLRLQRAEVIVREKQRAEALMRQRDGMENFQNRDSDRRLAEAAKEAHKAA
eukprot:9477414-Pyramimonas_sp.AAC.1